MSCILRIRKSSVRYKWLPHPYSNIYINAQRSGSGLFSAIQLTDLKYLCRSRYWQHVRNGGGLIKCTRPLDGAWLALNGALCSRETRHHNEQNVVHCSGRGGDPRRNNTEEKGGGVPTLNSIFCLQTETWHLYCRRSGILLGLGLLSLLRFFGGGGVLTWFCRRNIKHFMPL